METMLDTNQFKPLSGEAARRRRFIARMERKLALKAARRRAYHSSSLQDRPRQLPAFLGR